MGKIKRKDIDSLVKQGFLTKKDVKEMEKENTISRKSSNPKKYMKSADGKWIEPMFYFKGLKKDGKYSKDMTQIRTEVNSLIGKYTIIKEKTGKKGVNK